MSKSKQTLQEEMFSDWLLHPVTEALRQVLADKRQERKDKWEDGNVLELGKDQQMLLNAAAIGECNGFKYVQELTFETLQGDMEDGEPKRPTPVG